VKTQVMALCRLTCNGEHDFGCLIRTTSSVTGTEGERQPGELELAMARFGTGHQPRILVSVDVLA
jgi:hypothetical protein